MRISWAWLTIVLVLALGGAGTWCATTWSARRSKVEFHVSRGEAAAAQRRWGPAASELEAAIALDPTCVRAWLVLADVQFRQEQHLAALASLSHVPSNSSQGAAARLLEGTVLLKVGRASQAETALGECLKLDSRSIEARRRLVFLFGIELRRTDLRRTLWELHALDAAGPTDLVLLSGSTFIVWNAAEIMGTVEKFVASDAGDVFARVALGRYRMRQSDLAGARQILQEACRFAPDDPEAHVTLAECLIDDNDLAPAAQLLNRIQNTWPQDPRVEYCLARIAESDDRTDTAIDHYRRSAAADPDHRESHYRLGQLLLQSNRTSEAEPFLDRARKLAERETLLSTLVSSQDAAKYSPQIARLEVELKHDRLARAWYTEALRQNPTNESLKTEAAAFESKVIAEFEKPSTGMIDRDWRLP